MKKIGVTRAVWFKNGHESYVIKKLLGIQNKTRNKIIYDVLFVASRFLGKKQKSRHCETSYEWLGGTFVSLDTDK